MQRLNAPTFFDLAMPLEGSSAILRNILLVALGSLLLVVSAQTKYPIGPVPITLQSFVILMIGATYGWRLAGTTVLTYFAYGIAGYAVFATPPFTGAAYLFGASPTAGFLWGFLLAAVFLGAASQYGLARNPVKLAIAMFIATVIIYIPGLLWGATFIGAEWLSRENFFGVFVTPFLIGDSIKVIAVVALVPIAYKFLGQSR